MLEREVGADTGEFLLYQAEDGQTRIQCRMEEETLWLTQAQMAELFQTSSQNVTGHLKAIFSEGELDERATCKDYLQVRSEVNRSVSRDLKHYRLEVVLAVGFRVRSQRGTQFRQWATERLSEYLVKGFTMDDARLKMPPGPGDNPYFEELLARIRDIRSSEKVFWRKVLDIYATSVDYEGEAEASQLFFKTVQNKMHWAAHGQTAAEVITARANASELNMGLTGWAGAKLRKADVAIAKNCLTAEEIEALNRIVTSYLEFAEARAMNRKPMYMADWIAKLDGFLPLADREVLTHAGTVSHQAATLKAGTEYAAYSRAQAQLPSPVETHFTEALAETKRIAASQRAAPVSGRTGFQTKPPSEENDK